MPAAPPRPPVGGCVRAASPTRKIRPRWKRSATSSEASEVSAVLSRTRRPGVRADAGVGGGRRQQNVGEKGGYGPGFRRGDRGRDAIFILLERHQFGPEAQIHTEMFGLRSQDRLQQILSNLAAPRRAAVTDEE